MTLWRMRCERKCGICEGKGHVLDFIALLLPPLWVLLPLEWKRSVAGLTRRSCNECKGRGWISTNAMALWGRHL